jgi:hypothetical protein
VTKRVALITGGAGMVWQRPISTKMATNQGLAIWRMSPGYVGPMIVAAIPKDLLGGKI